MGGKREGRIGKSERKGGGRALNSEKFAGEPAIRAKL